MAGSIVQYVENDDASGSDQASWTAPSITPTAGNTLLAVLWYNNFYASQLTFTVDDSTGSNDSWGSAIISSWNAGTFSGMEVWKISSVAGAATTVRFTPNASQLRYSSLVVMEISGLTGTVVGSAAQHQDSPGTGTDGISSGNTGTLSAQPAFVVGVVQNELTNGTPAVGTGYSSGGTGWDYGGGTAGGRWEYKSVTSTSAVAATFTAAANNAHYTIVVAFEESGGAATTVVDLLGVGIIPFNR